MVVLLESSTPASEIRRIFEDPSVGCIVVCESDHILFYCVRESDMRTREQLGADLCLLDFPGIPVHKFSENVMAAV